MGRTAVVTYEAVRAAAAALTGKGITVSANTVRHELGDIGGNGTIQKFLAQLRRDQEQAPRPDRMLPHELAQAIFRYVDDEVARVNTTLKAEVGSSQQAVLDIGTENEQLAEQVSQQQANIAALEKTIASLEGRIQQQETELVRARNDASAERAKAEQARAAVATAELQLETAQLKLENANIRQQLTGTKPSRSAGGGQVRARRRKAPAVADGAPDTSSLGDHEHIRNADGNPIAGVIPATEPVTDEDARQGRLCE